LFGFTENFCAPQPHQISPYRATMTQPYVYWTLDAPLVTIIGLYSNVEGTLDARGTFEQQKWLQQQLTDAKSKDGFIVVAVHHPPYSLDKTHGGYLDIVVALDQAIEATGVIPHAVLSGHVHDMQRFTRRHKGREIPYVVEGRGGYANTLRLAHKLQKDSDGNYPEAPIKTMSEQDPALDLDLEYYDQESAGFLRVTVTSETLTIDSFSVAFDGAFEDTVRDTVTVTRAGRLNTRGRRSQRR
jgi:2',3'-cyclic-nucleotide 2'-phosphodiesterase (5'-nucleotidase family)